MSFSLSRSRRGRLICVRTARPPNEFARRRPPELDHAMTVPDLLCPTQRQVYDRLLAALPAGNLFEVRCKPGRGRTTVLSVLHGALGGALLTVKDFVACLSKRHPLALEEAFYEVVLDALREQDGRDPRGAIGFREAASIRPESERTSISKRLFVVPEERVRHRGVHLRRRRGPRLRESAASASLVRRFQQRHGASSPPMTLTSEPP